MDTAEPAELPLGLPWWIGVAIIAAWLVVVVVLAGLVRRRIRNRRPRRRSRPGYELPPGTERHSEGRDR